MREERERQRRSIVQADVTYRVGRSDPFAIFDITPRRERGWDIGKAPTIGQEGFFKKHRMPLDGLNRAQASQVIGNVIARLKAGKCTYRQTKILRQFGYDPDLDRAAGNAIISRLKANGWRPLKKAAV